METPVQKRYSIQDRLKLFDNNPRRNTVTTANFMNPLSQRIKIFPDSKILEEKQNMKIYKYPNKPFPTNIANNSKILLFLGNAQECFINSFINIYREIEFKDEFRYKINLNDINTNCDIYSFNNNNNIRIISIPFCKEKNENYIKNLLKIISINLVFYTFDENFNDLNEEQLKEIEFYKYLINYLNLNDKLIFLYSSKNELKSEEIQKFIKRFKAEKDEDIYEEKSFTIENKIYYINNKNLYDNSNDAQKCWDLLKEKMEILKNTIKSDKRKSLKEKHELFQFLLKDNEEDVRKYFIKLNKKESNYFIYFFGEITFEKERHKILLTLINSIIMKNSHKRIDMNDNGLEFIDDKNYKMIIRALSKLPFNNLKKLIFRNCELSDENIKLLKNLIITNLENLDLSKNKLQELNHILSENIDNLTNLDLSNNNISSLSQFKDMKFNNLIDLNLSFNKISDMECLGDKTNFDKLENLNLSNNKIKKLKAINIKSLKHLDLLKNEISEGIIDFMANIKTFSNSLNLKFDVDSVLFQYEKELNIEFTYKLGSQNIEQFFKELNLNQIKEVKLLKSEIFNQNASYNISDKEIKFSDDKNNIILNIITKFEFEQINLLELTNCNLVDKNVQQLEILFSSNLENLNLSYNKIQDINIFVRNEKLNNLKQLNLSHNDISDVASLSNGKLSNLVDLDISFNKIEGIDFIESNTNLDTLEKLNLSNNQIKKLLKMNLKNIKYLNILDNEITDGINEFIESIRSLSHKLILEKLSDSSFKYDYDGNLITRFKYSLKDNKDITQFLKEFSFNGINELKLQGFDNNNIKFLSNESLEDIKELDLIENDLNIISIFDNIHFPEAKKIKLSKNDFKDDSLDNLKNFSSIKVKSITINLERINLKYENPELEINSSNFNILHDNMGEIDEIKVEEFPNDLDIFSYDSFSNKKLPPFKDIKVESLNVTFENQKYSCEMVFKPINVKASYKFDNLDFMKSDEILSEIKEIKFSNVCLGQNINFEKDMAYKSIKQLEFNKCKIENIDIFEQINDKMENNDLTVISNGTQCNPDKYMYKDFFYMEKEKDLKYDKTKVKLTKEDKILKYIKPFQFKILINSDNKYDIIKNAYLSNIEVIDFSNAGINNIDFLTNNSLKNLRNLSLNNNSINDISILTVENIHFNNLATLNLKENPIKKGIKVLKEKFFKKCIYIRIDLVEEESKVLVQFYQPEYNLDIYVNNLSEISNIFQKNQVFLGYSSSKSTDKFKEIFSLTSEDYDKKCKTLGLLSNCYTWNHHIRWFYELKEEEFKEKKDSILDALKLLSNNDNNDIDFKKLFSDLDIYLNLNKFNILFDNFDLFSLVSIDNLKNTTSIDLSLLSYVDIKVLCESEYFTNLKNLTLEYNSEIANIECLERAKFVNLKNLNLHKNNLNNINFLANVPFIHLEELNVSENNLDELPNLNFPELKNFNLMNNKINLPDKIYNIGRSDCKFNLKGNYISETMLQGFNIEDRVFVI